MSKISSVHHHQRRQAGHEYRSYNLPSFLRKKNIASQFLLAFISLAVIAALTVLAARYVRYQASNPEVIAFTPQLLDPSPVVTTPILSPTTEVSAVPSPVASAKKSTSPRPSPFAASPEKTVSSALLSVPFTVQAPDGDWSEPWQEGCEEAALIMADAYHKGNKNPTLPVSETKQQIQDMVNWEIQRFGSHRDLGTEGMVIIAKEYMGYSEVSIKNNASLSDLRAEIRNGYPVILPAAGRLLNNPYFTAPGPVYHVFIVKGYDGDQFITNENGTKRGKDYRYSSATIENAWHDQAADIVSGAHNYLTLIK